MPRRPAAPRDAAPTLRPPTRDDAIAPRQDRKPSRDAGYKGQLIPSSEQRDLMDEAAELGFGPLQDGGLDPASPAPAAAATPWKRKKRTSSDVFEGDAALKELRSRLASAPTDQAPEPPAAPAKTPFFTSAARILGVVGLAAGGALAFLWITSPQGPRSARQNDEVALVSLRDESSKAAAQNRAAEQSPDPWSVAKLTDDGGNAASTTTPPGVALPRSAAPPPPRGSAPANRVTAPPPPAADPAPAWAAPAPAAVPAAPVVVNPPPPQQQPAAAALDRDDINAMLARARTLLSSGDVAAARLVLRRVAAGTDDPQAAFALGSTYDPTVLKKLGIISFHADPAQAREWYRKAADLGSADASLRLEQMVQTDDR